jgi:hypothetical protein
VAVTLNYSDSGDAYPVTQFYRESVCGLFGADMGKPSPS